jgi:hypothetical protein
MSVSTYPGSTHNGTASGVSELKTARLPPLAVRLDGVVVVGIGMRMRSRGITANAQASQLALMPPLPPQIGGISIAARYRSATPGAWAGGDLYEIIPTGYGIRVIIGDVRGNGLDAVLLARHVLSAFRRSAVAVSALDHVAGEVSRAIKPHLGEEDFVTAALVQIGPGGELTVVNCGHHPPLLHRGGGLRPLTGQKPALPLGLEDDFTAFTASWRPGDRLLLYTDGLVESRNQHGDFLPQDQIATALLAAGCDQALDALMTAVNRHTGGHGHDDMALLLLEHGAHPHSSANGNPGPGPVKTLAAQQGPAAVTQRSSARSRHWLFRCCSGPSRCRMLCRAALYSPVGLMVVSPTPWTTAARPRSSLAPAAVLAATVTRLMTEAGGPR